MQRYCLLTAVFCLIYYAVICAYTRRWNSTFSFFWALSGAAHILLYSLWNLLPGLIQSILVACVVIVWSAFIIIEMRIICAMHSRVEQTPEYLIILGAQVRGRKITNSLRRRLDKAYELWKQNPGIKLIVSGGQGKGEHISEAEAMEIYLLDRGVIPKQILKEDKSISTKENLEFSRRMMNAEDEMIGIVTNNFHVYRAILLAKSRGFKKVCGISANTNPILFVNYMVREFFAIIWMLINKRMSI